uniref:Cilium assembly protein DZIP1 N-terminal domain-containing protein n=1 Tax=Tetradesmus obliquus TaxID=3088 RepID=A0A383WEI0_TETOB|eukprot:jgi/Sobl393_1/6578/SZX76015.1
METTAGPGFDARTAGRRDQLQTLADADGLPVTYQPFKFESRRSRIDWRLLHGVDINKLIRDTDLDTLERLVGCLAWGDIEAEDSRHLSEASFVKVFRLAQLLLEYLLYVQDSLKHTNSVLEVSRSRSLQHMHALNSRCRELQGQLKQCKQELRRARKTVKTLELVATAVSSGAATAAAPTAAAAAAAASSAVNMTVQGAAQQQQQHQAVPVVLPASQHVLTVQQQGSGLMYTTAGELLLQSQMTELTERLAVAGSEAERLRNEREELCYQVRNLHDTLAARTDGIKSSQRHFSPGRGRMLGSRPGTSSPTRHSAAAAAAANAQLQQHQEEQQLLLMEVGKLEGQMQQLQTENAELRQQLMQKSSVDFTATNEVTAGLQAQLDGKIRELLQLQSELRQSETSMAVFKQANETLKQQLDALQKQLNSPEAATPSFVAKQRTRLAAAESKAEKAEAQAQQLQVENLQLVKQVEVLQAQLSSAGIQSDMMPETTVNKKASVLGEDSVVAAAEELLSGRSTPAAARGAATAQQSSSIQQQQVEVSASAEWKLAEIQRLQDENRLLQAKVTSLQQELQDLERLNAQLERQAAKARNLGLAASLESGGRSGSPSPLGQQHHLAAPAAHWAGASVNSSGPREELTAADLAAARGSGPASPGGEDEDDGVDEGGRGQQGSETAAAAAVAAAVEQGDAPVPISVRPAAATAGGDGSGSGPAGLVKGLLHRFSSKGKAQQDEAADATSSAAAGDNALIPAFRPEESAGTAQRPQQQNASVRHDGAISREAAQQLKALVAAMADKPAEQIAADYAEALIDWETPFKLEPEEDAQFGELLPLEMPGRPGLLMAEQHNPQELAANQGRLLASINRQLDQQVASFGIHPGRTGLSNQEVVAAMQMLSERRQALEASLPEEQRLLVDMARVGLVFNCYNGLQGVLQQQPQGADGKQHLPGPVAPLLVSEVQPPASMLPVGPPSVRLAAGAGPRSMPGAPGNRGMLPSSFTNAASPAASSRYGAFAAPTSEDEASSPQRIPYQSVAMTPGSGSRPDIAAALLQATSPHSPASAGPLSSGPAVMASRTASYTAAAYRAGAVNASGSGRSSPEVSQAAISTALSCGGFSPMSAALHVKQQLGLSPRGSASPVAVGAAAVAVAAAEGGVSNATGGSSASPGPGRAADQTAARYAASATSNVPQVSPRAAAGGAAAQAMANKAAAASAARTNQQQQQQQQRGGTGVMLAAAVANKDYLNSSFNESDEF